MMDWMKRRAAIYATAQEEAIKLACVVRPTLLDLASDEVARRAAFFDKLYRETPAGSLPGENPRIAALRSVTHDAMQGRLG